MTKLLQIPINTGTITLVLSFIITLGTVFIAYGKIQSNIDVLKNDNTTYTFEVKSLKTELIELKLSIVELKTELKEFRNFYVDQRYPNPFKSQSIK